MEVIVLGALVFVWAARLQWRLRQQERRIRALEAAGPVPGAAALNVSVGAPEAKAIESKAARRTRRRRSRV